MVDKLVELVRGKLNIGEDNGRRQIHAGRPATQIAAAVALLDRGYGRPGRPSSWLAKPEVQRARERGPTTLSAAAENQGAPPRGRPPLALSSSSRRTITGDINGRHRMHGGHTRARRPGACTRHAVSGRQIVRAGGATGSEGRRRLRQGRTSCRRPSAPAARPWWATPDGKEAVGPSACLVSRPSRSGPIDDLSVAACLASGNFPSEIFQSSPRRANAMALHGHSATRTTICAIPPARAPCRDPGTRNRGSA